MANINYPRLDHTIPVSLWEDSRLGVDPNEYNASSLKYNRLANMELRNSDTVVVSGYGCQLKVEHGALIIEWEQGHIRGEKQSIQLNRGTHKVKQIILCSHGGSVTIAALEWATQQNISVLLLNWRSEVVTVFTPQQSKNARLTWLQYGATLSGQGIEIARELIRLKTLQQIETLKRLPSHPIIPGQILFMNGKRGIVKGKGRVEYSEVIWKKFEDRLARLHQLDDIEILQHSEGSLATSYWSVLIGIPIHWKTSDRKKVPAHWHSVTERISPISSEANAQHSINPFHAALNFSYALLKAQVLQSIIVAGLDETVGFLHSGQKTNQPLAFDLMEAFRPMVDRLVLDLFSKQVFSKGDFAQSPTGEVSMNEQFRRYILAECRVPDADIDKLTTWLRSTLER